MSETLKQNDLQPWTAKWPRTICYIRHCESAYNILRERKAQDPLYQQFVAEYEADYLSEEARRLADYVESAYTLGVSDYETPATDRGRWQALVTGQRLPEIVGLPDIILYSPYARVCETLSGVEGGWPALSTVPRKMDDRLREQEHGLSLLYIDWRVYNVRHPEQKRLRDLVGAYSYCFPQGEATYQVRDRARSITGTLIREFAGQNVMIFTHHLTILSTRANFESWTPERFLYVDEHEKPKTCGVTLYKCNPDAGAGGKLELEFYNQVLYPTGSESSSS